MKRRVELISPYDRLQLIVNNGALGYVLSDPAELGYVIVSFDDLPQQRLAVPCHWLKYPT